MIWTFEKRERAVFAFLILTCVRDDALVSIKMKDVDIEKKTLWQDPKHRRTKFRKGIVTAFVVASIPAPQPYSRIIIFMRETFWALCQMIPYFPRHWLFQTLTL